MFTPIPQRTRSSYPVSRSIRRSLLLLLTLSLLAGTLAAQNGKDTPALEPGKPIERELAGDAAHSYRITVAAQQFLHVVVEQKGIDVVVSLFAPDGKKVAEVDSPNGTQGPEPVSMIAETTGSYRLEVRSLEKTAAAGRYEVKVEELRTAVGQDKNRVAAEQAFMQAGVLRGQGTVESLRNALKKYEEALPLYHSLKDVSGEAEALGSIGFIYALLGENQRALEYYAQALPLIRASKNHQSEAAILTNIGGAYYSLSEMRKALDYFTQALPLFRAVGDRQHEAAALNKIANVYQDLGEKQKALEYSEQALPLRRAVGDQRGEAVTLSNIGSVYKDLGETQKALEYFSQALPLTRAAGDRRVEASILNGIGSTYDELGEKQKALEYFTQSLPISRTAGDRNVEAATLNNIARVYNLIGENQKAFDSYAQALSLVRAVGDRNVEAHVLSSIGSVYVDLGEEGKALDYYTQALLLSRAVENRQAEAAILDNIANVYKRSEDKEKALNYYTQALMLSRTVGDRRGEAIVLNNIGVFYGESGEKQKALDYYVQALPLMRAAGDRGTEASTLDNIGFIYHALGNKQKALDYYTQALTLSRAVGDRGAETQALNDIASLEAESGNLSQALTHIEAAFAIVESLRTKIGSQELRSSYFATHHTLYENYINILMQLHKQHPMEGYDSKALKVSERGRARSLLETLAEANADIRQGVDSKLLEHERALQQQLNAKAQRQMQLLSGPHTDEQAAAIAKEIDALTTEFQQIEAQIRQTSPHYAALTQPQSLTLKEIQTQVLDPDTLLLEYSLGSDRSYLWAVTPNTITSYELPKREELEKVARQFYEAITARPQQPMNAVPEKRGIAGERHQQVASQLSQMLLAPVAPLLGKKRLLIVADGALQYVPFAALPVPASSTDNVAATPLIVEHEIVNLPSASTLAVLRREAQERRPPTKTLAVLADPIFERTDERLNGRARGTTANNTQATARTEESRGLGLAVVKSATEAGVANNELRIPRLPGTRREADEIMKLVPPNQAREALDFAASRVMATSPEIEQYRYVHFATHGLLNSQHPELSGVVLAMFDEQGTPQDGFLRAHEIFNLKLNADVVVLSACQTGLGKEVKGEGLISLTRGFMYAGTPRVVVSLWSVSDAATAELMTRFYKGLLVQRLRPAQALQAAQVSMLKEPRFASPFYWAAFTLQGEWR